MKRNTVISWLLVILLLILLYGGCATGNQWASSESRSRVFIDFSGYTGSPEPLTEHQPPAASTEPFSLENGITGDGLRVSNLGEGGGVMVQQYEGGMAAASEGNYMYFFIDNAAFRRARTVTMIITFFDDSTGSFRLQYISTGGANPRYTSAAIPKGNTNTFVTVQVQLDNCDFNGPAQNQGAHFRFDTHTSTAIIKRLEIVTGSLPDPLREPPPPFASSTEFNNMIGKVVTGYQVWFDTTSWHHWRNQLPQMPGPGNVGVEMWPAGLEDYLTNGADLHDTGFTMPDGSVGRVFNSQDVSVIRTHHQWLRDAGIAGTAVQRFFGGTSTVDTGDAGNHLTAIRDAAEEFGRIFYVMYDMTGAGSYDQSTIARRIQIDWIYNVERKGLVSSPNYAQVEGRPVVCIWGLNAVDNTRFASVEATIELILWFRNRGYYVKGGVPDDNFWEAAGGSRHRRGREMYSSVDMISPWYVGRDIMGQVLGGTQRLSRALEFCRTNNRSWADNKPIAFMPTIWPGFGWTNLGLRGSPNETPRNAGLWIWNQVREYLNTDTNKEIQSLYLSMFDEYDEATAWMKTAADYFDIPLDQYFLTLAADGYWLSSDYYLRLANGIASALASRNTGPGTVGPLNDYTNSNSVIVEHSLGPVFWRNSFERRSGRSSADRDAGSVPVHHLPLDPGIPHGEVVGTPLNVTVSGEFTVNRPPAGVPGRVDRYTPPSTTLGMVYGTARSGDSAFRLEGQRAAGTGASYLYKIADTRIRVESGMRLSYWINAAGLGTNVMVDLLLDNGVYVSASAAAQNTGTLQSGWQQRTLNIPAALNGRYITAVIVAYRDNGTSAGNFAAFIDDISINN